MTVLNSVNTLLYYNFQLEKVNRNGYLSYNYRLLS